MSGSRFVAYTFAVGLLLIGNRPASAAHFGAGVGPVRATAPFIRASEKAISDGGAGPTLYVSDLVDSIVYVYRLNSLSQPTRVITKGVSNPQGLAVDAAGQLYVANSGPAQDVTVYSPRGSKPVTTYPSQYFSNPQAVAIGADGTVYVANYGNGTVVEFPSGQRTPSLTITLPGSASEPAAPQGLALDSSNNLYVSYNAYFGGGYIEMYPAGSASGVDLGILLSNAGGVVLDKAENVVVCDRGNGVVDVFPPGFTAPSKVIGGFYSPNQLAFTKNFKELVVTDPDSHNVDVFSYPTGNLLNQTPTLGYRDVGIAIGPAAPK